MFCKPEGLYTLPPWASRSWLPHRRGACTQPSIAQEHAAGPAAGHALLEDSE